MLIDTKYSVVFSDAKQTLDQNNSVGSGDYRVSLNEKKSKNVILRYPIFEQPQIAIKIFQNLQF